MKFVKAFLQLIRWQNLVFIALTQWLLHFAIINPLLSTSFAQPKITGTPFYLLIAASVLIAAGGNVINDYFDINIDQINKPQKLVVDKIIGRRWVIFWHLLLSLAGIICSMYVSHITRVLWIVLANTICVLLLFIYSASLKKKFLTGNIVVSALTAWTILIFILPEYHFIANTPNNTITLYDKVLRLGVLYTAFAFIISLIREVLKDMEDIDGDRKNGCKTMPIVWGMQATKVFVAVWILVLIAALAIVQGYVIRFGWILSVAYSVVFIISPLIYVFTKLFKAYTVAHFHKLSTIVKLIMLFGILSMLLLKQGL